MATGLAGVSELNNTMFIAATAAFQDAAGPTALNFAGVAALTTAFFTVAGALPSAQNYKTEAWQPSEVRFRTLLTGEDAELELARFNIVRFT